MENENNISQELLETIERYLKGTMSSDEHTSFELQMEMDAKLRQQVDDTRIIFSGIRKAVLKDKLNVVHKKIIQDRKIIPDNAPKVFKPYFRTLTIAASVLILIGGFWFFNQQPNNEKLFEQFFEPDRGLATVMSTTDNYDFDDAMVDYKNEKYDVAIQKWNVLLKSKPKNDTLNYFIGVAHLANKNEVKAIDYLKKTIEVENGAFALDAYYYLGLAQLKLNNAQAAIANFQKNNSPKSKEIISELID